MRLHFFMNLSNAWVKFVTNMNWMILQTRQCDDDDNENKNKNKKWMEEDVLKLKNNISFFCI